MQRSTRRWLVGIMGLSLVLLATGCGGPSLSQVKGVVKVDGKPAKGVSLTFVKVNASVQDMPSNAVSGDEGVFTLSTGELKGAEPGKYKVVAIYPDPSIKLTPAQLMAGATPEDAPDLLNGKYSLRNTQLEVEIPAGGGEIGPLDLKP
jgi:hypothetical protein